MDENKDGFKYFITFLDDYTKVSEVEILRAKSEAFPAFRRYLMRNERGDFRCNRLRTDWGGEYSDHEFDRFRAESGIMWEPTASANPQQNGSSERLNQDLKGCVSTVLQETKLSYHFWPPLIIAANYLRNRRPTQLRKLTLYEAATGCKPNLKRLRPLGSYGWCIARKPVTGWKTGQNRIILEAPGRLVGYEGEHIYRMLLDNGKIYRTSQVVWGKIPPSFLRVKNPKLPEPLTVGGPSSTTTTPPPSQPAQGSATTSITIGGDEDDLTPLRPATNPMVPPPTPTPMAPSLTPAGTPPTPASTVTSSDTATDDAQREHSYLEDRDLSPDPLALLASIARESQEPKNYEEATSDSNPESNNWIEATEDEINSLMKNSTWELVDCPSIRKPLRGK